MHYIKIIGLILMTVATTFGKEQFKNFITFSVVGCKIDTLWFGVNSGDGIIPPSTYAPDVGPEFGPAGTWRELMYPSYPMSFSFVPTFQEPRGYAAESVWGTLNMRPYDYRGPDRVDTFQIRIQTGDSLADGFPKTGITITWSKYLLQYYNVCLLLKKTTGTTYKVLTDMAYDITYIVDDDSIQTVGRSSVTYLIIADNTVGVEEYTTLQPTKFELEQNYPNPFNPTTEFKFSVAKKGLTTLKVYNTLGQEIMNLFNGTAEPGKMYQVSFDGSRLASGVYFYRLISSEKSDIKKMVLLK